MKYYLNEIFNNIEELETLPLGYHYVGLFTQCETKGEENFCGYYSCEKYLDTELIAYCVYKKCLGLGHKSGNVVEFNKHFDEVRINTHMWTKVIEANSDEEAIQKFENGEYRNWSHKTDEFSKTNNVGSDL